MGGGSDFPMGIILLLPTGLSKLAPFPTITILHVFTYTEEFTGCFYMGISPLHWQQEGPTVKRCTQAATLCLIWFNFARSHSLPIYSSGLSPHGYYEEEGVAKPHFQNGKGAADSRILFSLPFSHLKFSQLSYAPPNTFQNGGGLKGNNSCIEWDLL